MIKITANTKRKVEEIAPLSSRIILFFMMDRWLVILGMSHPHAMDLRRGSLGFLPCLGQALLTLFGASAPGPSYGGPGSQHGSRSGEDGGDSSPLSHPAVFRGANV
jgi:hypothetical protein